MTKVSHMNQCLRATKRIMRRQDRIGRTNGILITHYSKARPIISCRKKSSIHIASSLQGLLILSIREILFSSLIEIIRKSTSLIKIISIIDTERRITVGQCFYSVIQSCNNHRQPSTLTYSVDSHILSIEFWSSKNIIDHPDTCQHRQFII